MKKGKTYKIKVKIKAAGNNTYKAKTVIAPRLLQGSFRLHKCYNIYKKTTKKTCICFLFDILYIR